MWFDSARLSSDSADIVRAIREAATMEDRRGLLEALKREPSGSRLAVDVAGTPISRTITVCLAADRSGLRLATALAVEPSGRSLTKGLASVLAADTAVESFGRALATDVGSDTERRAFTGSLAARGEIHGLAPELSQHLAGRRGGGRLARALWAGEGIRTLVMETVAGVHFDGERRNGVIQHIVVLLQQSEQRMPATTLAGGLEGKRMLARLIAELSSTAPGQRYIRAVLELVGATGSTRSLLSAPCGVPRYEGMTTAQALARVVATGNGLPDDVELDDVERQAILGLAAIHAYQLVAAALMIYAASVVCVAGVMTATSEGDSQPVSLPEPESIADRYDFDSVERLDVAATDKLRAALEPLFGQITLWGQSGVFDPELEVQVAKEAAELQKAITPDTTLGAPTAVVHAYIASLVGLIQPFLNPDDLQDTEPPEGVDASGAPDLVEVGKKTQAHPNDAGPAIEVADGSRWLAPLRKSDKTTADWVVRVVLVSGTAAGGADIGAGLADNLDLSWLPPDWAAVIGAILGIAGASVTVRHLLGGEEP